MDEAALVQDEIELVLQVLGKTRGAQLVDRVLNLEKLPDIRQLRPLLQA